MTISKREVILSAIVREVDALLTRQKCVESQLRQADKDIEIFREQLNAGISHRDQGRGRLAELNERLILLKGSIVDFEPEDLSSK